MEDVAHLQATVLTVVSLWLQGVVNIESVGNWRLPVGAAMFSWFSQDMNCPQPYNTNANATKSARISIILIVVMKTVVV